MITIWVQSISATRPRRTHRIRPYAMKTECDLPAFIMSPVNTSTVENQKTPKKFCHVCFKYHYRFLSQPKAVINSG